jgi:hypothetical protein
LATREGTDMEIVTRSETREFWHCYGCGNPNPPESDKFCSWCGREKAKAQDEERWKKFFSADATIVDNNHEHADH